VFPFEFIEPLYLWAALGVAIPIVIHLLFRLRSRKVELGTLRFLRIVLEQNARRRRLKRWLLLALRMAAIMLLAGLFARPYLRARDLSGKDRLVAILIDRSASMQLKEKGRRLLDLAVEQAREVIGKCGNDTQVEVAFFDQAPRPVGAQTVRAAAAPSTGPSIKDLLSLLMAPEKTYSATNYGTVLAWARDLCLASPHERKQLYIYTDLQRSGLDWSGAEPMPAGVEVNLVDLGRTAVNNVGLSTAQTPKHLVRPGDAVNVQAAVFNAGPFPLEKMPVVLTLESGSHKHVLRERVSLEPSTSGNVAFELPALTEGLWKGTVRIETEDDLPFDNLRHVAVLCAPPVNVLLADGDPRDAPLLAETYFLDAALRLAPRGENYIESPFRPTTVALGEGDRLGDLSGQRIVVLANVGNVSRSDAAALARFVGGGGGLLVFTGDRVTAEGWRAAAAAGLTVGEIGSVIRAHDLPHRFEQWDESHPLFEPFNDPQHGDLRRFAFGACTRIVPADDARVVAWFRGERPALLEKRLGKGRVLWFTSACDREWSDWTRSRLYLPFVHQMLGYLAGLTGGGPVRDVLIDSTAATLAADTIPGVFERDEYTEVINTGPRESEIDRCTPEEFANRFQLTLHEADAPAPTVVRFAPAALAADLRPDELWHWAVFILLGALLVEGFIANRTPA
jgi:hypothetical protein